MSEDAGIAIKAAELREQFDRAFASPSTQAVQEIEDLLAIRVGGEAYAIRLRHMTGIVTGRKLVALPTATADFLGLAGIRAGIVAVFGLASLLGHAQGGNSSRWMLLCGADEPIALGFSDFEGYLRVPQAALHADPSLRSGQQYVEAVVSTDAGLRAVIGIPAILATIRNRIGQRRFPKGQ